jgi:hypothetical protein
MAGQTNSMLTRVRPVFGWLRDNGDETWPEQLVRIAKVTGLKQCGRFLRMELEPEQEVPPTRGRLLWMLQNVERLAPVGGRRWEELRARVVNRDQVLRAYTDGSSLPREYVLEGPTHSDCLIECEDAFIWIEGKRNDWLSPSTTWDVSRDQLARNLEAVWSVAQKSGKDYCLIICHEQPLKHHETALIAGYRSQTWSAGWPHIPEGQRAEFSKRIGTITWVEIARRWSISAVTSCHFATDRATFDSSPVGWSR